MLNSCSASGGVSMNNPVGVYAGSPKRGIAPSERKEGHKYDSVSLSTERDADSVFLKELVSRISHEVRTATTTGDIQALRQEIASGNYHPDPAAIAARMLFISEG